MFPKQLALPDVSPYLTRLEQELNHGSAGIRAGTVIGVLPSADGHEVKSTRSHGGARMGRHDWSKSAGGPWYGIPRERILLSEGSGRPIPQHGSEMAGTVRRCSARTSCFCLSLGLILGWSTSGLSALNYTHGLRSLPTARRSRRIGLRTEACVCGSDAIRRQWCGCLSTGWCDLLTTFASISSRRQSGEKQGDGWVLLAGPLDFISARACMSDELWTVVSTSASVAAAISLIGSIVALWVGGRRDRHNRQRQTLARALAAAIDYREFPYVVRRRRADQLPTERPRITEDLR